MNEQMKKHLEDVVTAIVNENAKAAKQSFAQYLTMKTKSLLEADHKYWVTDNASYSDDGITGPRPPAASRMARLAKRAQTGRGHFRHVPNRQFPGKKLPYERDYWSQEEYDPYDVEAALDNIKGGDGGEVAAALDRLFQYGTEAQKKRFLNSELLRREVADTTDGAPDANPPSLSIASVATVLRQQGWLTDKHPLPVAESANTKTVYVVSADPQVKAKVLASTIDHHDFESRDDDGEDVPEFISDAETDGQAAVFDTSQRLTKYQVDGLKKDLEKKLKTEITIKVR